MIAKVAAQRIMSLRETGPPNSIMRYFKGFQTGVRPSGTPGTIDSIPVGCQCGCQYAARSTRVQAVLCVPSKGNLPWGILSALRKNQQSSHAAIGPDLLPLAVQTAEPPERRERLPGSGRIASASFASEKRALNPVAPSIPPSSTRWPTVFHNCKRASIGLREARTKKCDRLSFCQPIQQHLSD
jgi:hypothetical protein